MAKGPTIQLLFEFVRGGLPPFRNHATRSFGAYVTKHKIRLDEQLYEERIAGILREFFGEHPSFRYYRQISVPEADGMALAKRMIAIFSRYGEALSKADIMEIRAEWEFDW